jgi:hypothetical protein
MNPIQAISTFFTVIAILLSSADTTRAQSSEQKGVPEIEKPKLAGRFYQHSTPHVGEVTRGILTAATNQFSFVVPEGFRRRIDIKDKSICLTSASLTASLTAKICETVVDGQVDLKPESVRQLVLGRYQNSRIVEEFNASIESMTGPAFEIEWAGQACKMSSRVAFVPYPGGHIEVTVQSPTAEFRSYDAALFRFLISVRTSPIGSKLPVMEYLTEL